MEYVAKTVESPKGLSQEKALIELQEHPKFVAGSKIRSIRQAGDKWAIRILEPKVAEFPPKKDDEEEPEGEVIDVAKPEEEGDSSDEENPFEKKDDAPSSDDEKPADDEGSQLAKIEGLLHKLVTALGLDEAAPEEALDGPPGPPVDAGPPPPGAGHGGPRPGAGRPPGGAAHPPHDIPPGASPMAGFASVEAMAREIPSFQATADANLTVKEAKEDLEKQFGPYYKVKQVKPHEGKIAALLSVR